jgi:hypothetical protein
MSGVGRELAVQVRAELKLAVPHLQDALKWIGRGNHEQAVAATQEAAPHLHSATASIAALWTDASVLGGQLKGEAWHVSDLAAYPRALNHETSAYISAGLMDAKEAIARLDRQLGEVGA